MRGGRGLVAALVSTVAVGAAVAMGLALFLRPGPAEAPAGGTPTQRAIGRPVEESDYRWGRVTIYPVIDDGTLFPVPTGLPADIWAAFTRIATPEYAAEHMLAMRVAYAPSNPIVASVEPTAAEPRRWTLTVNLATETERDAYLRTLVHEYAHLLTLDEGEFRDAAGACDTTALPEGCLRAGATLERFHDRFWSQYGSEAPGPGSESGTRAWDLYVAHSADFVSSYAATNVVEDFAETFAEFTIRERPTASSGPWARKILFLWDDPGFVAIRAHIRSWFADDLPAPPTPSDWQR